MFAENAAHRSIAACLACRTRKQKCDGLSHADKTCSRCRLKGRPCTWPAPVSLATRQAQQMQQRQQQQQQHASSVGFAPPYASASSTIAAPSTSLITPTSLTSGGGETSSYSPSRHPSSKRGSSSGDFAAHNGGSTNGSGGQSHDDDEGHRWRSRQRISRHTVGGDAAAAIHTPHRPTLLSPSPSSMTRNPAPLASLREMALLTPANDVDEDQDDDGGSGQQQQRSDSIRFEDAATADGQESSASMADDDQDDDNASRLDVDEQIYALQKRMGWTQVRLHEASLERRQFFRDAVAQEPATLARIDPLQSGLLDDHDVERLFNLFYETINVQHCLLDDRFDTWQRVHDRSRALFIVVCAATATIDEHRTSRRCVATLVSAMDDAVRQVLQSNAKSVGVVQALLLAFLFTQKTEYARDDPCWTLVDAAARIASELGLGHRLRSAPTVTAAEAAAAAATDIASSDDHTQRSAERAWALAILMQRSLGTFTGLWSVTKLDMQWDSLEHWSEAEAAVPGDVQHAGYLNLRRIEYFARSQLQKMEQKRFLSLESIRVTFNALFDEWHRRWVEHPRLAGHHAMKGFLMVIGLHIQLLINFTVLRLAHDARATLVVTEDDAANAKPPASASSELTLRCTDFAVQFCQFFLDHFERRANHLGRNIISMVTWSVMVLLQLDYGKGRLLATRVAVLLAGHADDIVHRRTFPRFYGRWLLSLINDLATTSSERKAGALLKNLSRGCHCGNRQACTHVRKAATATAKGGRCDEADGDNDNNAATPRPPTMTTPTAAAVAPTFEATEQSAPALSDNTVSAEQVLAHMAGPMTTDPFNEVWLNSFLDSLVPLPYSPDDDVDAPGSPYVGGGGGGGQRSIQSGQPAGGGGNGQL